ncbi:ribonuclease HI family protein [Fructobacillus tropaeoli]|uniref:ribonuclease HI family protein n=1 Tax=Fructobacillus tropaeoli TaxID=709323 RepID=UPI000AB29841|nr:ribonuclease HI family protein [Fructobacillus tropaeoli]
MHSGIVRTEEKSKKGKNVIRLAIDAAYQKDSHHASAGLVLVQDGQQYQKKVRLAGCEDNHKAEFLALLWAIKSELAILKTSQLVEIISDSKILVSSMQKGYAKHYQKEVDLILALLPNPDLTFYTWVSDRKNQGPHHLAMQALQD